MWDPNHVQTELQQLGPLRREWPGLPGNKISTLETNQKLPASHCRDEEAYTTWLRVVVVPRRNYLKDRSVFENNQVYVGSTAKFRVYFRLSSIV